MQVVLTIFPSNRPHEKPSSKSLISFSFITLFASLCFILFFSFWCSPGSLAQCCPVLRCVATGVRILEESQQNLGWLQNLVEPMLQLALNPRGLVNSGLCSSTKSALPNIPARQRMCCNYLLKCMVGNLLSQGFCQSALEKGTICHNQKEFPIPFCS